jgi:hypothetical protein
MQLEVVRKHFEKKGVTIIPYAVLSEEDMKPLCDRYGVKWCEAENLPLGRKHNIGLFNALQEKWDYAMLLGSDDIVSVKYFDFILPLLADKPNFLGSDKVTFYDTATKAAKIYTTTGATSLGAGRMFARNMIEHFAKDGALHFWEDHKNSGLDSSSQKIAEGAGYTHRMVSPPSNEPLLVDIKSEQNIWAYSNYGGTMLGDNCLKGYFPDLIIDKLLKYIPMEIVRKRVRFEHKMTRVKMNIKVNGEQRGIEFKGGLNTGDGVKTPGMFVTDNADVIEALKRHPDFGRRFFVADEKEVGRTTAETITKTDDAPVEQPAVIVTEEEVNTIQDACAYLNEQFKVRKDLVNTSAKINAWLKENQGKVIFQSPNLQGLYTA